MAGSWHHQALLKRRVPTVHDISDNSDIRTTLTNLLYRTQRISTSGVFDRTQLI